MANTWRTKIYGATPAPERDMLDLMNGSSSTRIIRVTRMVNINIATVAQSTMITYMQINRITAVAGGDTVTPISHDTGNSALNANTTSGTGRAITFPDNYVLRRYIFSFDDVTINLGTLKEWEMSINMNEVWNIGYGESSVRRLTLRAGQGVSFYHAGAVTVGSAAFEIEFLDEAS